MIRGFGVTLFLLIEFPHKPEKQVLKFRPPIAPAIICCLKVILD